MNQHCNTLAKNLLALASQLLNGDFGSESAFEEERLRNQLMRLWRRADFEAPPRTTLALLQEGAELRGSLVASTPVTRDPPPAADASSTSASQDRDASGMKALFDDEHETASGTRPTATAACLQRRRHATVKNRGESCPECGYTGREATA